MATLTRIGQIAVNVRDVKSAIAFYRDILGLEFLFEVPRMGFFNCDGIRLMLSEADAGKGRAESPLIYYGVDDIQSVYQQLTSVGVHFVSSPRKIATVDRHDLWMAFFHDQDKNVLGLMSEMPVTAPVDMPD